MAAGGPPACRIHKPHQCSSAGEGAEEEAKAKGEGEEAAAGEEGQEGVQVGQATQPAAAQPCLIRQLISSSTFLQTSTSEPTFETWVMMLQNRQVGNKARKLNAS